MPLLPPPLFDDLTGKLDVITVLGVAVVDIEAVIGFTAAVVVQAVVVTVVVVVDGNPEALKGTENGSALASDIGRCGTAATDVSVAAVAARLPTHIEYRLFEITIPPLPKLVVEDVYAETPAPALDRVLFDRRRSFKTRFLTVFASGSTFETTDGRSSNDDDVRLTSTAAADFR